MSLQVFFLSKNVWGNLYTGKVFPVCGCFGVFSRRFFVEKISDTLCTGKVFPLCGSFGGLLGVLFC